MQKSFWWWQCSDRYIISLSPPPTPFHCLSPFLTSLMISVDFKHHIYLTQLAVTTWLERRRQLFTGNPTIKIQHKWNNLFQALHIMRSSIHLNRLLKNGLIIHDSRGQTAARKMISALCRLGHLFLVITSCKVVIGCHCESQTVLAWPQTVYWVTATGGMLMSANLHFINQTSISSCIALFLILDYCPSYFRWYSSFI